MSSIHLYADSTNLEHPLQNTSSSYASFQVVHLAPGLVHVKRPDD